MRSPEEQTAYGPMFTVAAEQRLPAARRVLTDPLAAWMLPAVLRLAVPLLAGVAMRASERQAPGVWGGMLCRKRYFDDGVSAALKDGVRQAVILGAGLDTRACRLVTPTGATAYELDLPANVATKRRLLGRLPVRPPRLIPVDFETADLARTLAAAGYRAAEPAVFVWEGVTQYLTEAGVRATLAFLSGAAPGSRLLFTYVRRDFLDGTNLYGSDRLRERFVTTRRVWRFGLNPADVAPLLTEYGWTETEQLGGDEAERRYLRPLGRTLPVTPLERAVYAERR